MPVTKPKQNTTASVTYEGALVLWALWSAVALVVVVVVQSCCS